MTATSLEELGFLESPSPHIVTENRRIRRCNQAFAALFGYNICELTDQLVLRLYPCHSDYQAIGKRCLDALNSSATYEDERFMQHRNGEIFWARARGITLTPRDPFALMIWNFERIQYQHIKTASLTRREQEIAGYVANGLTCKEIAIRLGISYRTVELHRGRILHKLEARNVVELVSKFIMVSQP